MKSIPAHATAAVGQTVIVKAVDNSGVPTEWEAVDMPSDEHINGLIDAKLGVIENGKYYMQDGMIYKCVRDTGAPVYNALNELVGIYVETA